MCKKKPRYYSNRTIVWLLFVILKFCCCLSCQCHFVRMTIFTCCAPTSSLLWGRRDRDHMVVGCTATGTIYIYIYIYAITTNFASSNPTQRRCIPYIIM